MRHILSLKEQSKKDILDILAMAQAVKKKRNAGKLTNLLPNKTLVMLFQKSSTRTRLSFEAGMTELGGHSIFLDAKTTQFALTDFKDEIKAVMRFGSVLMFRAMKAADVAIAVALDRRGTGCLEFSDTLVSADQLARRVVEHDVERAERLQADRQPIARIVRHAPRVRRVRRERRNGQVQRRWHGMT